MRRLAAYLLLTMLAWLPLAASGEDFLYVQQDNTVVYKQDTTLSDKVSDLKSGEKVVVVERWGAWIRIRTPDSSVTGWVPTKRLGKTIPVPGNAEASETPTAAPEDRPQRDIEANIPTYEFSITINGPTARKFRMDCRMLTRSGKITTRKYRDTFPKSYSFRTSGINCYVQRDHPASSMDRMVVRFYVDGELVKTLRGGPRYTGWQTKRVIGFRVKGGLSVAR
jgi:hypothetical protein